MINWILADAVSWLSEQLIASLGLLVGILEASVFTTPDVTVFPQAQSLADRSATVVDAGFIIAIIVAAIIAMTHGTVQIQYQLKDLVPRLVFGFIASAFGVEICRAVITTANAATASMIGPTDSGPYVAAFVRDRLANTAGNPGAALLGVVIALLIVVLLFGLLATWLTRIGVLLIVAGLAPVALACHALPQTQPVASLWWRTLMASLATPLLQALFFDEAVSLVLNPDKNLMFFLSDANGDILNLFIIVVILLVTIRIPRYVSRHIGQSSGMSPAGLVLRTVVTQTITRRVPGLSRAVR